jgi:glycerol-1-phosphate dehydrogenase [NAD(P)+]
MLTLKQVTIPMLVRVKPGALDRVGIYAKRAGFRRIVVLHSSDLLAPLLARLDAALAAEQIEVLQHLPVQEASFEQAEKIFRELPGKDHAVLGIGGGKALDVAKYVAFLSHLPYVAAPTSLSNDGFCSPQSSLTIDGRRRSLPSAIPYGVVLDTSVCLAAPADLWLSGVGDLVAKLTAVADWKLAFHARGTPVDDFAALLSDATVFQFIARPIRDLEGVKLLGTALMLNGIAMAICGSSRPASGSEHLISHALDSLSVQPRLHGLQVGVATYLISRLQGAHTEVIEGLFEATGFWRAIEAAPFSRAEWLDAARRTPAIKEDFYTILSARDCLPEITNLLRSDARLQKCFVD